MSTSDKRKMGRTARTYAVLTVFCAAFGFVYEQFSHGVFSLFMGYLFLFLLFGGAVPFLLPYLLSSPRLPGTTSRYVYHSGLVALIVGSCLTGVLDIYGTTAPLVGVYWWAGVTFTAAGVLLYLPLQRVRRSPAGKDTIKSLQTERTPKPGGLSGSFLL